MSAIVRFPAIVLLLVCVLIGCKPRTKPNPENDAIRWAMMTKRMGSGSLVGQFIAQLPDSLQLVITNSLKKYENYSGTVEHIEAHLNRLVTVETTLEHGALAAQRAEFENGVTAFVFYPVHNRSVSDSLIMYFPSGELFSRSINSASGRNILYEQFHDNGLIQTRRVSDTLLTWQRNGNLSGTFFYNGGEVVRRVLWHPNGQKKEESEWRHDKLNGVLTEWDSLGNRIRNEKYNNGTMVKKTVIK